ncbi:Calpain family cysteine protease [Legionella wadsworthii]|uniref:Calpain family cysteine protease n=1 Tax=Legionella wadsworthii TaxID=28088 RepID=A0A378LQZ6_9GAMM|nr:C2 family cysteine protease [Legionella wadsworthii]STY28262.1 Calpain family cysteine protease [Legionella wadsworthii]
MDSSSKMLSTLKKDIAKKRSHIATDTLDVADDAPYTHRVVEKRITITDDQLKQEFKWGKGAYILGGSASVKLKKTDVTRAVCNTDISQRAMGNCFMLAALGSILKQNPSFIHEILKINEDGKVEIKLHHMIRDEEEHTITDEITTYVLDATKLATIMTDAHSHPAIFLLEKAFAIHRMLTNTVSEEEVKKLDGKSRIVSLEIESPPDQIKKKDFKVPALSYRSSLKAGKAAMVYGALLGDAGETRGLLEINYRTQLSTLIENFARGILVSISHIKDDEITPEERIQPIKKFAANVLGIPNDPQGLQRQTEDKINLFNQMVERLTDILSKMPPGQAQEIKKLAGAFAQLAKPKVEDMHLLIDAIFSGNQNKDIALKVKEYVLNEIYHHQRGTGIYTKKQDEVFKFLHDSLQHPEVVASVSTPEQVGTSQKKGTHGVGEETSKGLVGGHYYEVLDCYERQDDNGKTLKFVLVRNPWSDTAREYEWKEKEVGGKTISVLSAHKKDHLKHPEKTSPRSHPLKEGSSARGYEEETFQKDFRGQGYTEIELSDFTKRFNDITIAIIPRVDSAPELTTTSEKEKPLGLPT